MEQSRVSVTALVTAYVRAYHATHDDPKIFDDFLANELFTPQERESFGHNLGLSLAYLDPELAAQCPDDASALAAVMRLQSAPITLSRSRYTEERLERAVETGVKQYVILGAGFDTFAFRKPEMLGRIRVFEVDHPTTQTEMRRRVAAAGWKEPAALHWIPADFERPDIASALANSPFDPTKPSFFSWLGVTFYLSRDQVHDTLRAIAGLAPAGSPIIFDYHDKDAFDPQRAGKIVRRVQDIVRNVGEPMKTGFDPATLADELAGVGWKLTEDWGPDEIQARYFSDRADGYHAFEQTHIAQAVAL
ncbi:MAG: class I SAM-dependent methyltransferase [Chloroflexi bacterium]|nr:class I SAM-dependent methyltransferase [Chloroflexota bacterium]